MTEYEDRHWSPLSDRDPVIGDTMNLSNHGRVVITAITGQSGGNWRWRLAWASEGFVREVEHGVIEI